MPEFIYTRPWLYAEQSAAIFAPARVAVIEASAKSGKSCGCRVWLLEQALQGRRGRQFWWVAPTFSQTADIGFENFKRELPREVVEEISEGKLILTLRQGAELHFKSADNPDGLYGRDVWACVIDEATRCKEEAWHAIRTTLASTQGPVRIIGNVRGRRNWAYQLARRAESGEPDMAYARLTAYHAAKAIKPDGRPVLAPEEIEAARRQLPEGIFRELFLAEPAEDQGNPFGVDAIRACVRGLSGEAPVAWGWDLARAVDWTVGVALDADGAVCRLERWQSPSWDHTVGRILALTGEVPALVDATGGSQGDPLIQVLQHQGGPNFQGYQFTSQSKQALMQDLALAIHGGQIRYPEGPIRAELMAFEYEVTRTGVRYSAPPGQHDDCVCALALAWTHWQRATRREPLRFFGATDQERHELDAARRRAGQQTIDDAVRRGGAYFPGDR